MKSIGLDENGCKTLRNGKEKQSHVMQEACFSCRVSARVLIPRFLTQIMAELLLGWRMGDKLMAKNLRKHNNVEKAGVVQAGWVHWLTPKCQMKDMCIHSCYLNKTTKCECCPMKIPEVAAKSSAAKAVLDAGYVSWQVCSDELTPKLVAFTVLVGCCKFKQMMLGISFAPGIFQRVIAHICEGLQGAEVIMDGLWI